MIVCMLCGEEIEHPDATSLSGAVYRHYIWWHNEELITRINRQRIQDPEPANS